MLLVKTYVAQSKIEGLGLFASEFIPKGTKIWDTHPGFELKFTEEQVNTLPEIAQKQIDKYSYLDGKTWVLCIDDARHINHSDDPNTDNEGEGTIASRDIQPGEEITSNYYEICDHTSNTGEF